jgi:hypothetical protein
MANTNHAIVMTWLTSKGVSTKCAECIAGQYEVGLVIQPAAPNIPSGTEMHMVTLICQNCGHVKIFSFDLMVRETRQK